MANPHARRRAARIATPRPVPKPAAKLTPRPARPAKLRFPHGVEGYLSIREGTALFDCAREAPPDSIIVELGSYKGRSTICIARGVLANPRTPLPRFMAIDHFKGDATRPAIIHKDFRQGTYQAAFHANLKGHQVQHVVEVVSGLSDEPPQTLPKQSVSMLFIDGNHKAPQPMNDFLAWEPYLSPEPTTRLAFHDSDWSGVAPVIAHLKSINWTQVTRQGSVTVLAPPPQSPLPSATSPTPHPEGPQMEVGATAIPDHDPNQATTETP